MIRTFSKIILLAALILLEITAVKSQDAVTVAHDQFLKFNNVNGGWLAGDVTISLLLPNGNTLWIFGDSFIGETNGSYKIDQFNSSFINNAAIIEDANGLTAYYGGTFENPTSLIPADSTGFFWPEHAIIENDTLKIFVVKVFKQDNNTNGFNFRVGTSHIASFGYPEMEYINTVPIDYITDTTMRFGTHVLKRDNFTYIFGKKDTTVNSWTYPVPMLARVKNSVTDPWEFYSGDGTWSYNCDDAKPIGDRPVSESFFIHEHNGKFYMLMHEIWLVKELYILQADSLTGPWNRSITGGIEKMFATIAAPEQNLTYNLFAHPQFIKEDKLLISFNVNTNDFMSIYSDTRNYRARFYWLSIDDAMTSEYPDTLDIFEDFVSTNTLTPETSDENNYFQFSSDQLYVNNITSESVLSIYTLNGRLLYYKRINENEIVNLSDLPKTVLIVNLKNGKGSFSTKFIPGIR